MKEEKSVGCYTVSEPEEKFRRQVGAVDNCTTPQKKFVDNEVKKETKLHQGKNSDW